MSRWRTWGEIPTFMKNDFTLKYYRHLSRKRTSMVFKRIFDVIMSAVLLVLLWRVILVLAVWIKVDSRGPVFFRQERITQYGRKFRIHKFRTMVADAENIGSQVTTKNDMRVTKIGFKLRKSRLDELPQLIDILLGNMSFVGTRPETTRFVCRYTPEMYATLLLPAGVTSEASIKYKDEDKLLDVADNVEDVYMNKVLPGKMKYNLESLQNFGFFGEILTMIKTIMAVVK